ncbi:MAG TPA: tripartite tricarboxylate transporter substrate-binding protein [Burkholderiales bacterium]|jgi:tripartite-type tricarboxylate transporter receptor subunit TctC
MRHRLLGCAAAAFVLHAGACAAQGYPDHAVKIVVPIQPGGIIDAVARPIAEQMSRTTGQSVTTDYQPGALTNTGTAFVAHAPGDGYTLLVHSRQMVNNNFIFKTLPYDIEKDFVPISLVAKTGFLVALRPGFSVKSVKELIEMAKAAPGKIRYANSGKASNQQMSMELFKLLSHADIARIEFDGGGPAQDAVARGEADLGIFATVSAARLVREGKLHALATTGAKRDPALPEVPTVAESGLPGYEFTSWVGLFAPASTPPERVAAISAAVMKAARDPAFVARMQKQGAEVVADSPAEYRAFIKSELARWGQVIRQAGIEPQ